MRISLEDGMSQLSQEQTRAVSQWVEQGATLSDVQKKLAQEFGVTMTYMDVRLLLLELGAQLKDRVTNVPKVPPMPASAPLEADDVAMDGGSDAQPPPGSVDVQVDRIMKPGSMVSGKVRFSDGVNATWMLDQMGRLGISPERKGYAPTQADVAAFQMELRRALESRGF